MTHRNFTPIRAVMKQFALILSFTLLTTAAAAQATGETPGPSFGGLGSVAGGVTNRGVYLAGAPEGSFQNSQFGLRTSVPFSDKLSVSALVNWREDGLGRGAPRTDVTYLFATYRLSRAWDLRLGKVKSPNNLYSEVFDIGTLRPFLSLPQGIYGSTGNSFTSYSGVGVNGTAYVKNWQLGVASYVSGGNYIYKSTRFDLVPGSNGEVDVNLRRSVGARVFVRPPVSGLLIGLSGVSARISTCTTEDNLVPCRSGIIGKQGSAQFEYMTDRLWVRSEAALIKAPGFLDSRGGYAQVAWFATRKWQLAAQYDAERDNFKDFEQAPQQGGQPAPPMPTLPAALDRHTDVALGVNFWLSPDMVVKLSVHDVNGWRFARPGRNAILRGLATQQLPPERSRMLQAGIQFNF
jgi:hypothetical protein